MILSDSTKLLQTKAKESLKLIIEAFEQVTLILHSLFLYIFSKLVSFLTSNRVNSVLKTLYETSLQERRKRKKLTRKSKRAIRVGNFKL
jgi:hypothetical protein